MIERIKNLPPALDGILIHGKVARADIVDVLLPLLREAQSQGRKLRLLADVDDTFRGVALEAIWEELKIGLSALGLVERCAVVSDVSIIRASAEVKAIFGDILGCDIGVFHEGEREAAIAWLAASPRSA